MCVHTCPPLAWFLEDLFLQSETRISKAQGWGNGEGWVRALYAMTGGIQDPAKAQPCNHSFFIARYPSFIIYTMDFDLSQKDKITERTCKIHHIPNSHSSHPYARV